MKPDDRFRFMPMVGLLVGGTDLEQARKTTPPRRESCFRIPPNRYAASMRYVCFLLLLALPAFGQSTPPASEAKPGKVFDESADSALAAMTKRAEELKIGGVAVVAYIEGDTTKAWSSKMVVVGRMKDTPAGNSKGANLLAIAYAKAAEMAETFKDSGSAGRPPMTGETGWQGGLIRKGKTGYLIAAFSGGPSESDLKVSAAGLEVLTGKL